MLYQFVLTIYLRDKTLNMGKLVKIILDFLKKFFASEEEPVIEPTIDSGVTYSAVTITIPEDPQPNEPVVIETPDSGETDTEFVSKIKILIDNGHGNNTAGKRSPWSANKVPPEIEFYEYRWNREIAKPVVEELLKRGYDAELLVKEEKDISLTERANRVNKICNNLGTSNVILISIHSNAAGNGTKWLNGQGWEAYSTVGVTKSDKLAECLYAEAEKNFKGRKIRRDYSDGDSDKEANFAIIYKSACPAVLTENFFYDNVDDVQYILSNEGREAVIKTHVNGIINYINYVEEQKLKYGYYKA